MNKVNNKINPLDEYLNHLNFIINTKKEIKYHTSKINYFSQHNINYLLDNLSSFIQNNFKFSLKLQDKHI